MGVGGGPLPLAASRASKKRAAEAVPAAGATAAAGRNVRPECATTLQMAASVGFRLPALQPPRGSAATPAALLDVLSDEDVSGGSDIGVLLAKLPRHWNTLQFEAPQTAVRFRVLHSRFVPGQLTHRCSQALAVCKGLTDGLISRHAEVASRIVLHLLSVGNLQATPGAGGGAVGRQVPRRRQQRAGGPLRAPAAALQHVRAVRARQRCVGSQSIAAAGCGKAATTMTLIATSTPATRRTAAKKRRSPLPKPMIRLPPMSSPPGWSDSSCLTIITLAWRARLRRRRVRPYRTRTIRFDYEKRMTRSSHTLRPSVRFCGGSLVATEASPVAWKASRKRSKACSTAPRQRSCKRRAVLRTHNARLQRVNLRCTVRLGVERRTSSTKTAAQSARRRSAVNAEPGGAQCRPQAHRVLLGRVCRQKQQLVGRRAALEAQPGGGWRRCLV